MTTDEAKGPGGRAGGKAAAGTLQRLNDLLTSPKLAIALLAVVLGCCVVGVTVVRGERAGALIFGTLWFNGLLVLLAVSSGATFFSRIWKRKLTLVSVGMILFHLSFVTLLGGIVYNRLFFFRGILRLTEGETLPNGSPDSYDYVEKGRLFSFSRLRGETTLVKMHVNFQVDGSNKRAAYEVAVADGDSRVRKIIYVTEYLDFGGARFFCLKEGYSVLLVMSDSADGKLIHGLHVPLQSFPLPDKTFRYASGTSQVGEAAFPFPPPPEQPRADVAIAFRPSAVGERGGEVTFRVWPYRGGRAELHDEVGGTVQVGASFAAGPVTVEPREIRYWVGMDVRRDPGLIIILASLVCGVAGMAVTLVGRVRQGQARQRAVAPGVPAGRREEHA